MTRTSIGRGIAAALACALLAALAVAVPSLQRATAATPLTNLAHLDFLGDRVAPPDQPGHTTYRLDVEPEIGVLWTYADHRDDGSYERVGGGERRADGTWGQGAFNADDVTRAAVVYLRHWQQTGSLSSRTQAYDLLRGATYLQTVEGPDAGNVVLWMQPDGALNPSADPVELPDPSDSDESYWLARTIWALGEGYAAFRESSVPGDRAFAAFLAERLDLAVAAVERQSLDEYGTYLDVDGLRTPAWLIVEGGDATAEAVLGLSAYVGAGGPASARSALRRLSEGLAMLGGGDARSWPFGAVRPWAVSQSVWHAWGSQMPAALARASMVLDRPGLAAPAVTDSATFDPWMLTSGGPDQGRLPTRVEASQIAYGVDSRLQSLLATTRVTRSAGTRQLAGVVASWYFGANSSGLPAYDPSTGRTVDGIEANGDRNLNAGAESTIHGLLSMLALDSHPAVAELARTATVVERVGNLDVQAETGTLGAGARAVSLTDTWTGESKYGGSGYVALGDGGSLLVDAGNGGPRLVQAVVELQPGSSAVTTFRAGTRVLGRVRSGAVGAQGDSPAPGALLPVTLPVTLPSGPQTVTATTVAVGGDEARLDALMVEPLLSRLVLGGDAQSATGTALVRSAATSDRRTTVVVPGSGPARVRVYDGRGRLVGSTVSSAVEVPVRVVAGGFTIVRRSAG